MLDTPVRSEKRENENFQNTSMSKGLNDTTAILESADRHVQLEAVFDHNDFSEKRSGNKTKGSMNNLLKANPQFSTGRPSAMT